MIINKKCCQIKKCSGNGRNELPAECDKQEKWVASTVRLIQL